jgi:hypothetical protein
MMNELNLHCLLDCLQPGGAEAIVPTIPAPERLITAQAGGGTGIGHTCDRYLIHRSCPRARAEAIKIKIDKFY